MSSSEVLQSTPIVPDTDVSQTQRWIQGRLADGQCFNFVVELLPTTPAQSTTTDNMPVQDIRSKVIGIGFGRRVPEIGYLILPPFWGQGYASEALQAFLDAYWETLPEEYPGVADGDRMYVMAYTHWDNYASQNVLRKCGFEKWRDEVEESAKNGKVLMYVWRVRRPESAISKAT
ncbi:hypothetical protein MMC24_000275 [Lignoscripta atroalba]|nr:hypothetical protein [Lignoscripta atroalba]